MNDKIVSKIKMPDTDGNLDNDIYDIGVDWENISNRPQIKEINFNIHNSEIEKYINNPTYIYENDPEYTETNIPNSLSEPKNWDRPNTVDINLPQNSNKIIIYDSYEKKIFIEIEFTNLVSTYSITNLIPNRIYYYIIKGKNNDILDSGIIKTFGKIRMINGGGKSYNIRDIGGWKADGGSLKYGLIYRGSELNNTVSFDDNKEIEYLENLLNIKDEIDLRGSNAQKSFSSKVSYFNKSINYPPMSFKIKTDPNSTNSNNRKDIITHIANNIRNNKVTYIHCQDGADRTASICLLIEAICGVSQSDIDRDYELTAFSFQHRDGTWLNDRNRVNSNANRLRAIIKGATQTYAWWEGLESNSFKGTTINEKIINLLLDDGVSIEDLNTIRFGLIDGMPSKLIDPNSKLSDYGIIDAYTKDEVDNRIVNIYKFQGRINSLPSSSSIGDVYILESDDCSYVYNGSDWIKISENILDLSNYQELITENNKISSDLINDAGNQHQFVSTLEKEKWNKVDNMVTQIDGGITVDRDYEIYPSVSAVKEYIRGLLNEDRDYIIDLLYDELDLKVDKNGEKQLSTEDFTNELKTKLENLSNNQIEYLEKNFSDINDCKSPTVIYLIHNIPADSEILESGLLFVSKNIGEYTQILFTSGGRVLYRYKSSSSIDWPENFSNLIPDLHQCEKLSNRAQEIIVDHIPYGYDENHYPTVGAVRQFISNLYTEINDKLDDIDNELLTKADKGTSLADYGITDAQKRIDSSTRISTSFINTIPSRQFVSQSDKNRWDNKYDTPEGGKIRQEDLSNEVQNILNNATNAYIKPENGIILDDLSESIQNSLIKADNALQEHLTVDSIFIENSMNPVASKTIQQALNKQITYQNTVYNNIGLATDLNTLYQVNKGNVSSPLGNGFILTGSGAESVEDKVQYLFTDGKILTRKRESDIWQPSFTEIATPIENGIIATNNNAWSIDNDIETIVENCQISGTYQISNNFCIFVAQAQVKTGYSEIYYSLPVVATSGVSAVAPYENYWCYIKTIEENDGTATKISIKRTNGANFEDSTINFVLVYKCQ